MAYKYQNEIEDAVDVMVKVMGEEKHGKAQQELAEVYRKAEAFDRIKRMANQLDQYIESDADDYQKGYLIGKKLGELHELVNEGDSQ